MTTYKVIQDIEAEDKLIGPLTLRQFIFGVVAVMFYYFCYILISKHATVLVVLFLPPALFMTFFAIPFGRDQPTEVWALAKLRFFFKPRKRIWDQNGAKKLVTVTAPKKVKEIRTDGLSQTEVKSRLSALATTIDSRGWAIKNINLNLSAAPSQMNPVDQSTDRLIGVEGLPQEVPSTEVLAADDILDAQNNPIAQQFEQMITASTQAHRQQIMTMMQQGGATPMPATTAAAANTSTPTWFTQQPLSTPQATGPATDETALAEQIRQANAQSELVNAHLTTLQPLGTPAARRHAAATAPLAAGQPAQPMTQAKNAAILELAKNNDLNVATLARQAHKNDDSLSGDGEVVIALH